jgi:hypothetical protein
MPITISYLETEQKERCRSVESTEKKPSPYKLNLNTGRMTTSDDGEKQKPSSSLM